MKDQPFRWTLTDRRALGTLLSGEIATFDDYEELLHCCAKVIALGADYDLVFVGRSPENIFDHLSGLLFDSSRRRRLTLLQFSVGFPEDRLRWDKVRALNTYFRSLRLDPESLAKRTRPVAFVDLVCSGETFGTLIKLLKSWSDDAGQDWKRVRSRIRLIGITARIQGGPNTHRWQQHVDWLGLLESGAVKNISISPAFWSYLGDYQPKVTQSFIPSQWGHKSSYIPTRNEKNLAALRLAVLLFDLGRTKQRREEFAFLLCQDERMHEATLRDLVMELRKKQRKGNTRKSGSRHDSRQLAQR